MDSGHNAINGGNAQGVYSSGGDIVLAPSGGAKKKRWPIVVAILLFLIAIGAGVGAWFASRPQGGGNGGSGGESGTSSNSLKGKFNNYANYVLFGKDSTDDFNYDDISGLDPYFMTVGSGINDYLETAQNKYSEFSNAYYDGGGKSKIVSLAVYFQYYAGSRPLTMQDIINSYVDNGYNSAVDMINNNYTSDVSIRSYSEYLESEKNLALTWLEVVNNASNAGCISGKTITEGCYSVSEETEKNISNYKKDVSELVFEMLMDASDALDEVYKELYERF
ncbi:hypothetical protein IKF12_03410 [Candidatus Saccharibacteria bacterium]|nr:hypothetical protein [Candidatus Saccharibacteria bacterium]